MFKRERARERENLRGNVHVRMTIFDKFYEVTGGILKIICTQICANAITNTSNIGIRLQTAAINSCLIIISSSVSVEER